MRTALAAVLAAFFMLAATAALAQETSVVSIPWGDWVNSFLGQLSLSGALSTLLLGLASAILAMLPAAWRDVIRPYLLTKQVDQLFSKAAAAAIAGVRGAAAGKRVDVPVTNELVRTVLRLVIENGAPKVIEFAGTAARSLAAKALARLHEQGVVIPEEYTLREATGQAETVLAEQPVKSV